MNKIAFFEVGREIDYSIRLFGVNTQIIKGIPVTKISKVNFMKYDIIFIPMSYNQDILYKNWKKIHRFIKFGGVLIVSGFSADKSNWLKICNYNGTYLNRVCL